MAFGDALFSFGRVAKRKVDGDAAAAAREAERERKRKMAEEFRPRPDASRPVPRQIEVKRMAALLEAIQRNRAAGRPLREILRKKS